MDRAEPPFRLPKQTNGVVSMISAIRYGTIIIILFYPKH